MAAEYEVIVAYSVPVGVQDMTNGKGSSRGRKEKDGSGHSPTARPKAYTADCLRDILLR